MKKKEKCMSVLCFVFAIFIFLCAVINFAAGHIGVGIGSLGSGIFFLSWSFQCFSVYRDIELSEWQIESGQVKDTRTALAEIKTKYDL